MKPFNDVSWSREGRRLRLHNLTTFLFLVFFTLSLMCSILFPKLSCTIKTMCNLNFCWWSNLGLSYLHMTPCTLIIFWVWKEIWKAEKRKQFDSLGKKRWFASVHEFTLEILYKASRVVGDYTTILAHGECRKMTWLIAGILKRSPTVSQPWVTLMVFVLRHELIVELLEAAHNGRHVLLSRQDGSPQVENPVPME